MRNIMLYEEATLMKTDKMDCWKSDGITQWVKIRSITSDKKSFDLSSELLVLRKFVYLDEA